MLNQFRLLINPTPGVNNTALQRIQEILNINTSSFTLKKEEANACFDMIFEVIQATNRNEQQEIVSIANVFLAWHNYHLNQFDVDYPFRISFVTRISPTLVEMGVTKKIMSSLYEIVYNLSKLTTDDDNVLWGCAELNDPIFGFFRSFLISQLKPEAFHKGIKDEKLALTLTLFRLLLVCSSIEKSSKSITKIISKNQNLWRDYISIIPIQQYPNFIKLLLESLAELSSLSRFTASDLIFLLEHFNIRQVNRIYSVLEAFGCKDALLIKEFTPLFADFYNRFIVANSSKKTFADDLCKIMNLLFVDGDARNTKSVGEVMDKIINVTLKEYTVQAFSQLNMYYSQLIQEAQNTFIESLQKYIKSNVKIITSKNDTIQKFGSDIQWLPPSSLELFFENFEYSENWRSVWPQLLNIYYIKLQESNTPSPHIHRKVKQQFFPILQKIIRGIQRGHNGKFVACDEFFNLLGEFDGELIDVVSTLGDSSANTTLQAVITELLPNYHSVPKIFKNFNEFLSIMPSERIHMDKALFLQAIDMIIDVAVPNPNVIRPDCSLEEAFLKWFGTALTQISKEEIVQKKTILIKFIGCLMEKRIPREFGVLGNQTMDDFRKNVLKEESIHNIQTLAHGLAVMFIWMNTLKKMLGVQDLGADLREHKIIEEVECLRNQFLTMALYVNKGDLQYVEYKLLSANFELFDNLVNAAREK